MTCEKFEDALMDELYGELDEVTSAALRRHASTCARCSERLASMRATRKVLASSFGPVDPPAELEERIFAAAAEARKVVPIRSRMTRFVSVAGRWAMRPQTAMAAVFLVMIGSSVVFMRERPASMSKVVVTERGAPAESAAPEIAVADPLDKSGDLSAAAAHGPEPMPPASPIAAAAATATANAPGDVREKGRAEASPLASGAIAMNEAKAGRAGYAEEGVARRAPSSRATGGAAAPAEAELADRPAAKSAAAPPPVQATAGAPATLGAADDQGSPFASAMSAYRGKRYSEATRLFDSLAQQGDANAALWAARSERESSGCASAVGRFDRIVSSSYGTTPGYDATLEAGRCYRSLGSFEAARARFARLLTVPSHAARAQSELDAMNPRAAKAAAAPAGAPPPAAKPAAPAGNTGSGF